MRKTVRKTIRSTDEGVNLVGDVNAVVASQSGRGGKGTGASARQRVRIVQRNGRTMVTEKHETDSA